MSTVPAFDKQKIFKRLPQDDDELWWVVFALWGVKIPQHSCCPSHSAPFDAFAEAFFARVPVSVWKASRGFGGKSFQLALLAATEAAVLGATSAVLGGSGAQSANVHDHFSSLWSSPNSPRGLLVKENVMLTTLSNGAYVKALTASQTSVRGLHPNRLRMDEIDEMDNKILESAQGQPMRNRKKKIDTQTVMSSTHQYPDKTMFIILAKAKERGWPVHEWCIAEGSMVTTHRGQVAIELVGLDDLVLTRRGWRHVQHVTKMGTKETLILTFSDGRKLRCTPDHLLHTSAGWVAADSALSVTSIGPDIPVVTTTSRTDFTLDSVEPSTPDVLCMGNQLKVFIPDARSSSTDVVEFKVGGDGAVDRFPQQLVSHNGSPLVIDFDSLPPVPVDLHASEDVASGFHTHHCRVVSVERASAVTVWDIGVHGEHEFFVNGLLVHNCWRCTSNPIDGWLESSEVERKRTEITQAMWDAEYDLQEPSFAGRAIDTDLVEMCFDTTLGTFNGDQDETIRTWPAPEIPMRNNGMVTAVDWGKSRDWCIAATFDTTMMPWVCVAWKRFARESWPVLVNKAKAQWQVWGGSFIHDATGLGAVIADYIDVPTKDRTDKTLNGASRTGMFNDYIAAIEHKHIRYPRIKYAFDEHRYTTDEDLFGKGHPPDSFIAGALAWSTRTARTPAMIAPSGIPKESSWMG